MNQITLIEPTTDLIPVSVAERLRAAVDYCKSIESITISTAEQAIEGNKIANKLLSFEKAFKTDYEIAASPHLSALDGLRGLINPVVDAVKSYRKKFKLAVHEFKALKAFERDEKQLELNRASETDLSIPEQAENEIPYLPGRGSVTREVWKFEVTDEGLFFKHCIENGFTQFLTIDEKAMGKYARERKEIVEFPGAKITMELA